MNPDLIKKSAEEGTQASDADPSKLQSADVREAEEPKSESKDIQTRAAAADLLARTMVMKGFHLNPGNREDWHCQFGLQEDLVVSMTLAAKYGDSPAEWHILFRDWDPGKGIWRWKAASPLRFANPVAAATYALRHILPQCG